MRIRDVQGWARVSATTTRPGELLALGEVGTLVSVSRRRGRDGEEHLALVSSYGGRRHNCAMRLSTDLLNALQAVLAVSIGRPLSEIGGFELPAGPTRRDG